MATKVFWFSRHDMDQDQITSLEKKFGEVVIQKVNGTAPNVHVPFQAEVNNGEKKEVAPLKQLIDDADVVAVVAPIGLQQQFLGICGDRPLIIVKNDRIFDSQDKVTFKFVEWQQVHKIEVVTSTFAD